MVKMFKLNQHTFALCGHLISTYSNSHLSLVSCGTAKQSSPLTDVTLGWENVGCTTFQLHARWSKSRSHPVPLPDMHLPQRAAGEFNRILLHAKCIEHSLDQWKGVLVETKTGYHNSCYYN